MMRKIETKYPNFYYFVSGENPKLLIHSGTHGDESEVTEFVMESLRKYEAQLPAFIFVPEVTPSGVAKNTRRNGSGRDMNREFFSNSPDPEVQANIEAIQGHHFDIFVSVHEDPELMAYYLYDVGPGKDRNELVLRHNQMMKNHGVELLNGIDDLEDTSLGFEFVDGYNKMDFPEGEPDDGTISAWVLNRKMAKDYLLPEIPGKAIREIKKYIVDSFFTEVILKSF